MDALSYGVSAEVFAAHPGYLRGVVFASGVRNGPSPPALLSDLREAEAMVRQRMGAQDPATHPVLLAWREAYRRFGARPSEFRSSIEAMVRRVLKGDQLPAINALVDIGNVVSLRHLLPVGVHPTAALRDGVSLRLAREGDCFDLAVRPGEPAASEPVPAGEIVFAEGARVLTRRWTWRQAAGTQTSVGDTAVLFNVDGLPPIGPADVYAALADVQSLVREHCGGSLHSACLDAGQMVVPLRR